MRIVLIFILFSVLFSCEKKTINNGVYSINSRIILGSPTFVNLSEIADSVYFIKLETNDSALIDEFPNVVFADSLLVVTTFRNGVLIFDSKTGKYLYKIEGFKDRGPQGYSQGTRPLAIDHVDKIVLQKWDRHGIWNYKTGQMCDINLSFSPYKYTQVLFVNDSLLIGNILSVPAGGTSKLDVLSANNGSILREYGLVEMIDRDYHDIAIFTRSQIYDFEGYIMYYSMINDTIYGVSKTTLELVPRFVLNLGDKITPNVPESKLSNNNYISISNICESSRYLFLEFCYSDYCHFVCYDKKEGKTLYLYKDNFNYLERQNPGFINDISCGLRFFPSFTTNDNRAYYVMQTFEFISGDPQCATKMGIMEEDNPIIMVVNLKR